jgi:hypothetical protein
MKELIKKRNNFLMEIGRLTFAIEELENLIEKIESENFKLRLSHEVAYKEYQESKWLLNNLVSIKFDNLFADRDLLFKELRETIFVIDDIKKGEYKSDLWTE